MPGTEAYNLNRRTCHVNLFLPVTVVGSHDSSMEQPSSPQTLQSVHGRLYSRLLHLMATDKQSYHPIKPGDTCTQNCLLSMETGLMYQGAE